MGDAAFAPSFRSGQGTSLATVGAYVLATEIVAHLDEPTAALPAYEARVRGYVERNQALADSGGRIVSPATPWQLHSRNALLRMLPLLSRLGVVSGGALARAATAVALPDAPAPVGA